MHVRPIVLAMATGLFLSVAPLMAADSMTTITAQPFTFSYNITGDTLTAAVSTKTKGWISVGFGPSKMMKDANIIIGYATEGAGIVKDHFGVGLTKHQADTLIGGTNNLLSSSCTQKDDSTTLTFTILLNSGDDKDVVIKKGVKTRVIFAAGKKKDLVSHHFSKAKTEIVF